MSLMDVIPVLQPQHYTLKSQANNNNNINNNRGASAQHAMIPPLTGFSGGLSKNMDLHSHYERLAVVGQSSHSTFGSSSSVWRLSSESSFSSSSSSDSATSTHIHTTTNTLATTTDHSINREREGEEDKGEEKIFTRENEYLYAAAEEDDDDDDEYEEDDNHGNEQPPRSGQYNYQYRHIFSNSAAVPASTSHPPHFLELSFNIMTGPDRTNHASSSSSTSSHRANPLASANQPPRPPNAWILYRSDKLKNIPSPPPGAPKRPQAEVSKLISQMWKLESADVRGHYERLSEIKKAEHQAMYPGYRFQPMKKEDKDRIRAEKQAEKEREREARKANRKTRVSGSGSVAPAEMPPLFTTQARALPSAFAVPSTAADATALPVSNDINAPQTSAGPAIASSSSSSSSGPPGDLPTPPNDNDGCTPPSLRLRPPPQPSSSSSSSSSTITTIPPLLAPQPTPIPQRPPSPSAWEERNSALDPSLDSIPSSSSSVQRHPQQQQDTSFSFDGIPTWFDSSLFLPDPPSDADSYITVPLPSQQPLGWSPDDPGPLSDMHFSFFNSSSSSSSSSSQHPTLSIKTSNFSSNPQSDPPPPPPATATTTATVSPDQLQLHAVVAATSDPNIFALDFDFTNNELFDGTREIQLSMAPSMLLSAFNDFNNSIATGHANEDFTNLLNWDPSNFSAAGGSGSSNNAINYSFASSYSAAEGIDYSLPLGLDLGTDVDMDGNMDSLNASSRMSTIPSDMGMMGMGLTGPSFSLMSMMSTGTPSVTSANTSQTSLHPTPPPHWSTRDEQGEKEMYSNESDLSQQPGPLPSYTTATSTSSTTPYVPPAGAIHSSTRRVAADWRRIRVMTPDPELELASYTNLKE